MGRTARKRAKKKNNPCCLVEENLLSFQKWIHGLGWTQSVKLKLKRFPDTGLGLMAMENIKSGDIIVTVPPNLMITAKTVADSEIGKIFKMSEISVPLHLVLSAFIVYEKHLGTSSFWNEYISVLPSKFLSPVFCTPTDLEVFPLFVQKKVILLHKSVKDMLSKLHSICNSFCSHCFTPLENIFSVYEFLWAWFVVNSRIVYVSPSDNLDHPLKLSGDNSFALAPYLDMLNHSNSSCVSTSFTSVDGYKLKTLVPFKKFEQVFIHYGNHDNLKLFIDYGFILYDNEHDVVILEVNEITLAIINFKFEKRLRLIEHKYPQFLKDLFISKEGLSWNSKVLIFFLISPLPVHSILHYVYEGSFEAVCSEIVEVSKLILCSKINQFENDLKKIRTIKKNDILGTGAKMFEYYLDILKEVFVSLS